jgi:tetratricopeptide (TPR) repeat protein
MAKSRTRTRIDRREEAARAAPPRPGQRRGREVRWPAPATEPLDLRREWRHPAGVFALVLALYAATSSRTVCLEDDGLFVLAARGLGLPQPPGYPLLVLLGKLFTFLPFGSLAYRVHLASAVCGAATCAVLWLTLQHLMKDRVASWAGALLLGVSAEFWSQSIIAEVYALNALLFFLTVYLILDYGVTRRPRTLYLLSATYGLSLANHWPLMGLSTACLFLLLLPRWRDVLRRLPAAAGLSLLCAALPYAWMVWRSHQHPEISFYGPIRSARELWFFFSRQGFGDVDVSETASGGDRGRFLGFLLRECLRQFTWAGAALAAVGLWVSWRRWPRALALAVLAGFLGSSFVLLLLLSFDYELLYRSVFRVYPLVPYGLMVVWLVLGGRFLLERVPRAPAWLPAAAWGALVAAALALNLPDNQRAGYGFARDYARTVLGSLEPDAILVLHGDMDTFPIAYEHLAEGVRPDVTLYNDQGLLFDDRLYPHTTGPEERSRLLGQLIRSTSRPVYFTDSAPGGFTIDDGGLRMQVRRDVPPGKYLYSLSPETLAFLERMEGDAPRDTWTVLRRDALRRRLARILASFRFHEPALFAQNGMQAPLEHLERTPQGLLGALDALTTPDTGLDVQAILARADRAEALLDPGAPKKERAFPDYARGRALRDAGRLEEAAAAFRASLRVYPSHENPAILPLLYALADLGRPDEVKDTVNRYLAGRPLVPGLAAPLEELRRRVMR